MCAEGAWLLLTRTNVPIPNEPCLPPPLLASGRARKLVFHSIHMQFEGCLGSEWADGEVRVSRMVVIGRKLSTPRLQAAFERCSAAGTCEAVDADH